jgi:hypothetical protein
MLKNEKLEDVRIAFIFSATLKEDTGWHELKERDSWAIWEKCIIENGKDWYYWKVEEKIIEGVKEKIRGTKKKDRLSTSEDYILDDYILVENFFLSKQLFHVGRDYTMISRFTPSIDLELIFPMGNGNTMKVEPTVIISFYRSVGVVTLTLNIVCDEIETDDLIYIKSLKWNSIKHYAKAPRINIAINGNDHKEQYFCDIFKLLWNEVFENKLKIETESESILDLIEVRDKLIGERIFRGKHNDLLFGLLVGDEGYTINSAKMITERISNPDICMEYRKYFKYFFAPTTILGLFSKDYPVHSKEEFAKFYAERYENFEPLCEYIKLVSDIANLSDGLALVGEVTLVRYTVLKEIDLKIRAKFEDGKTRFLSFFDLLKLKKEIMTRMVNIELLTKDILWINLLSTTDEMFGYNSIKKNMQERLGYIDSQIRDTSNFVMTGAMLALTVAIAIMTIGDTSIGAWLWTGITWLWTGITWLWTWIIKSIDWFIEITYKHLFIKF